VTPNELFEKNRKLVFYVIYKKVTRTGDFEDMLQSGFMGLWKACNNYDEKSGSNFSSYAIPLIIGEVKNPTRENIGHIKVPRKSKLIYNKIARREIEEGIKIRPTIEEVQKEYGVSEYFAKTAIELLEINFVSTDIPGGNSNSENPDPLGDTLIDYTSNFEDEVIKKVEANYYLSILSKRDRLVVELVLEKVLTQNQIAEKLGITQTHVSRIYKNAIAKIKKYVEVKAYEDEPQLA
jgi:RNA polymerase sporulation-specific sigma factor